MSNEPLPTSPPAPKEAALNQGALIIALTKDFQEPSGFKAKEWIALSSFIVAVCALVFSFYQAHLQRQFLKLSTEPRLAFSLDFDKDGAGVYFVSVGRGPGTLKTFEVFVDGKPQRSWAHTLEALNFVGTISPQITMVYPETVFKTDEAKKLIWLPKPHAEELVSKVSRLSINACYCSIFDDCWSVSLKNKPPEPVHECSKPAIVFVANLPGEHS